MFKKIIFFLVFFVLFAGCKKVATENVKGSFLEEYSERYVKANSPFVDESLILSTIAYMDGIIEREGNKRIESIFYDKARLLFRLKQFDEALGGLSKTENEFYDYYRATLLIRLGRENEAIPLLENMININKSGIMEMIKQEGREKFSEKTKSVLQGLMMYYVLAGLSRESVLNELTNDKLITLKEAEKLFQEGFLNINETQDIKKIILDSTWPE